MARAAVRPQVRRPVHKHDPEAVMVAYSFQRRFVAPICLGLGRHVPAGFNHATTAKLHTIRAPRKRHARPGEMLQLYYAQRTKHCLSIGVARCTEVKPIEIFVVPSGLVGFVEIDGHRLADRAALDAFARSDGFEDWNDMLEFWRDQHAVVSFKGVIIHWEAA
jgi:hypothetical protein